MSRVIILAFTIFFLGCLFEMPYWYFQLIRFFGFLFFCYLSYWGFTNKSNYSLYLWVCSAVLINPFFKFYFGRQIWNVLDVLWVILLIFQLYVLNQITNNSK
jgi:hypothetical protein